MKAHKYFTHGAEICQSLRRTFLFLQHRICAFLHINNMGLNELVVFTLSALQLPLPILATSNYFNKVEVLQRDVCVIGGGASGTYAAVRLQQMGKSVALIEKQSRLGGQFLRPTMRTFATNYPLGKAMLIHTKTRSLEHLWTTESKSSPTCPYCKTSSITSTFHRCHYPPLQVRYGPSIFAMQLLLKSTFIPQTELAKLSSDMMPSLQSILASLRDGTFHLLCQKIFCLTLEASCKSTT